ncbi:MAG: hypothetical protein R3Y07_08740 [Eubacteriales bacterium]
MKKTTIIASTLVLVTIVGVGLFGFLENQYHQTEAEIYVLGAISTHYKHETSEEYQKMVSDGSVNVTPISSLHTLLLQDTLLPESEKAQYIGSLAPEGTAEDREKLMEELRSYDLSEQVYDLSQELMESYLSLLKFSVVGGEQLTDRIENEELQIKGYQGVVHFEIHPLDFLHDLDRETLDKLWETHTAEQGVSPETRNSYLVEVLQTLLDSASPTYLPPIIEEVPVTYIPEYKSYSIDQAFPTYQQYDFMYRITTLVFAFDVA